MRLTALSLALVTLAGTAFTGTAFAQEKTPEKASMNATVASDEEVIAEQLPSYPLTTCPVSHEPLGDKPRDIVFEGRLVRLCCKACTKGFKDDPAATLAAIDKAVIEQQAPTYPLTTCLVSGEPLDSMGGPLDVVHGTRLVRLCCKGCKKGFAKNPAEHMAKIDAALIEAQKKDYPLTTCLVSGEPLEGGYDMLYGTRLTRFCCKKCAASFKQDPAKYLAKLDGTAKKMK